MNIAGVLIAIHSFVEGVRHETLDERTLRCAACAERMVVPIRAYRNVRENGRRFLLLPGHENPAVEQVVERQPAYFVVETFGRAGEVADALAGNDRQAAPPT